MHLLLLALDAKLNGCRSARARTSAEILLWHLGLGLRRLLRLQPRRAFSSALLSCVLRLLSLCERQNVLSLVRLDGFPVEFGKGLGKEDHLITVLGSGLKHGIAVEVDALQTV